MVYFSGLRYPLNDLGLSYCRGCQDHVYPAHSGVSLLWPTRNTTECVKHEWKTCLFRHCQWQHTPWQWHCCGLLSFWHYLL